MTKQELIDRIYQTKLLPPSITKKAVVQVVDALFAEIGEYFVKTKLTRSKHPRLTYPGFGTFVKKRRSSRTGRNPQTGQPITIPEVLTITFSPAQELKGQLKE